MKMYPTLFYDIVRKNYFSNLFNRCVDTFLYLQNAFGLRFLLSTFNATMILSKLLDEQRPFQNDSKDSQKFGGDSE